MSKYAEGDATRVIILRPTAGGFWEPNESSGFGADVNVTNPNLATRIDSVALPSLRPASESTLLEVKAALDSIFGAVDGLEAMTTAVLAAVDTLEANTDAVESLLATLNAKDFATQTTLEAARVLVASIRDTHFRRTDPLAAGANVVGYTEEALLSHVFGGSVFQVGGKITTSVTTSSASLNLTNPAGSGKTLIVVGWSLFSDTVAEVRYVRGATSTGTVIQADNRLGGGAAPVATAALGVNVLSGGTQLNLAHQVAVNVPLECFKTLTVSPGSSFGIRYDGPGAVNNVFINIDWRETTA